MSWLAIWCLNPEPFSKCNLNHIAHCDSPKGIPSIMLRSGDSTTLRLSLPKPRSIGVSYLIFFLRTSSAKASLPILTH